MGKPEKSPWWAELDRIDKAMSETKNDEEYIALDEVWFKVPAKIRRAWITARIKADKTDA